MQLKGNWNYPTSVRFGAGRISELAQHASDCGMQNPLFVTDPGLAAMPMTQKAFASLQVEGFTAALFTEVKPNPVAANIEAGIAALRKGGH
ncbi:MAG: iron-containing alcohol dehydrogenase, partial [Beijerinckiaceae bacterium]